VHVPLGNAAILEAQILMLASHNILNPANGTPITVPSQDMVLGLYYITKGRKTDADRVIKGEGLTFYSPEEVIIAYNEKKLDLHAFIKVKVNVKERDGQIVKKVIDTTVGRVLFNQMVPEEVGYINELLTKKSLRDIIGDVVKNTGMARAAQFLDEIKELGFQMAFRGGLSFNLQDLNIPAEKVTLIDQASKEVEEVMNNYNMGFITNNERYNQIIDIWTRINNRLTANVMEILSTDNQGFNSVYMMLDSGARGSKEQIRQLCGMRGLMAKPQKSGSGGEIIENPILSNFKEGLSVLEYFISTHGARKGLADTALKTADAGYLTRRLHDVAQDMIVGETDCGTLRGIYTTALKDNEDIVEPLYDRILGRTALSDVHDPLTNELLIEGGNDITEDIAKKIENSPLEGIEIRSVLTCEAKRGVCALCYGRNLASGKRVQRGEAVGVIAAQSIGEPGTQLTLRTFHVGGTASNIAAESQINAKFDGIIEFENVRTVQYKTEEGEVDVVLGRSGEFRIIEKDTNKIIVTNNIPYGSYLYVKDNTQISKGDRICSWDPYNAVIISEFAGKTQFEAVQEGITFREESDEQTGHREKVIIDTRDKTKNPVIQIIDSSKNVIKGYNIPVGAHIAVDEGEKVQTGQVIAKIPRSTGKTRDITGGLPRVTELFEARNPSNPAVVTEIDGVVTLGGIKRGNREITIESKDGQVKKYLVPLSKHILVQDNDFIKAGMPLSDGSISPADILAIKGPAAVQEYLVNGIQEVYRLQGVKINDKHFEVIVHQMMQKVTIEDAGDTRFLEREAVDRWDFMMENDEIYDQKVVVDPGSSNNLKPGQIISVRKLRDENSVLKRKDLKLVEARDAIAANSSQMLQGITRASLGTKSFISAASFQETTKVLNEAAIAGKRDKMLGLKENVIVGHLIPSGTGLRAYDNVRVGSQEEFDRLLASKSEEVEA
uniref:DNA-directed RNA polymerase subunit beta' n=1 Tax=uncultured Mucilaginibacter sp. TaxID=797541 RepID=UPI0026314E6F